MKIERELSTDLGEKVVLYIETPRQTDRDDEFFCVIGVNGAGINKSTTIYGIDPLQALILAIRHINGFVERESICIYPRCLIWESGEENNRFGLII